MKVPLEPIPKEPSELVKKAPQAQKAPQHTAVYSNDPGGSKTIDMGFRSGQLDKAYPWMFGASITLSAILCWMYVTKPVIVQSDESSAGVQAEQQSLESTVEAESSESGVAGAVSGEAAIVPSDTALPGAHPAAGRPDDSSTVANHSSGDRSPQAISPAMLAKSYVGVNDSQFSLGWESTNLKVQHILSADTGSGELEKIVLNVPVLYETRTMRWSAGDIAKARNVMNRLMLYENHLNKLRGEGQSILKEWNELLVNTAPTIALRADSPSLLYNHGQGSQPEVLPDSSSAIKLDP